MNDPVFPKRNRVVQLMAPILIAAALCAGGGATLQARSDEQEAARIARAAALELARVRDAGERREAHLKELFDTQRKANAKDKQDGHARFLAFTDHAARLRHDLGAMLEASRLANDGCQQRIAAISEATGELQQLLGESVSLLEDVTAENGRLAADGRRLYGEALAWEQRYRSEHPERITVTGQKR